MEKIISSEGARFKVQELPLKGAYEIEMQGIVDSRGSFSRLFCEEFFEEIGFYKSISQVNTSFTKKKGSVRGLHFQYPPSAEIKIVTCLKGEIFDVLVDIRKGSPTFLQWVGVYLSEENKKSVLIPEGFAHGFQTMTSDVDMLYFVSASYDPEKEGGLNILDPNLGIKWPYEVTEISDKDKQWSLSSGCFLGVNWQE